MHHDARKPFLQPFSTVSMLAALPRTADWILHAKEARTRNYTPTRTYVHAPVRTHHQYCTSKNAMERKRMISILL
jgi:hypothetical protein